MTPELPPSPTASTHKKPDYAPSDYNPDLAAAKLAEKMIDRMPAPAIVSKEFVVWYGLLKGLNHRDPSATDPGNLTYFDCSPLLSVFEGVSHNSVNIKGALFEKFWTYMNKPKMIVQGIPGQNTFNEDEEQKQSILDRMFGWFRGGDKNNGSD